MSKPVEFNVTGTWTASYGTRIGAFMRAIKQELEDIAVEIAKVKEPALEGRELRVFFVEERHAYRIETVGPGDQYMRDIEREAVEKVYYERKIPRGMTEEEKAEVKHYTDIVRVLLKGDNALEKRVFALEEKIELGLTVTELQSLKKELDELKQKLRYYRDSFTIEGPFEAISRNLDEIIKDWERGNKEGIMTKFDYTIRQLADELARLKNA